MRRKLSLIFKQLACFMLLLSVLLFSLLSCSKNEQSSTPEESSVGRPYTSFDDSILGESKKLQFNLGNFITYWRYPCNWPISINSARTISYQGCSSLTPKEGTHSTMTAESLVLPKIALSLQRGANETLQIRDIKPLLATELKRSQYDSIEFTPIESSNLTLVKHTCGAQFRPSLTIQCSVEIKLPTSVSSSSAHSFLNYKLTLIKKNGERIESQKMGSIEIKILDINTKPSVAENIFSILLPDENIGTIDFASSEIYSDAEGDAIVSVDILNCKSGPKIIWGESNNTKIFCKNAHQCQVEYRFESTPAAGEKRKAFCTYQATSVDGTTSNQGYLQIDDLQISHNPLALKASSDDQWIKASIKISSNFLWRYSISEVNKIEVTSDGVDSSKIKIEDCQEEYHKKGLSCAITLPVPSLESSSGNNVIFSYKLKSSNQSLQKFIDQQPKGVITLEISSTTLNISEDNSESLFFTLKGKHPISITPPTTLGSKVKIEIKHAQGGQILEQNWKCEHNESSVFVCTNFFEFAQNALSAKIIYQLSNHEQKLLQQIHILPLIDKEFSDLSIFSNTRLTINKGADYDHALGDANSIKVEGLIGAEFLLPQKQSIFSWLSQLFDMVDPFHCTKGLCYSTIIPHLQPKKTSASFNAIVLADKKILSKVRFNLNYKNDVSSLLKNATMVVDALEDTPLVVTLPRTTTSSKLRLLRQHGISSISEFVCHKENCTTKIVFNQNLYGKAQAYFSFSEEGGAGDQRFIKNVVFNIKAVDDAPFASSIYQQFSLPENQSKLSLPLAMGEGLGIIDIDGGILSEIETKNLQGGSLVEVDPVAAMIHISFPPTTKTIKMDYRVKTNQLWSSNWGRIEIHLESSATSDLLNTQNSEIGFILDQKTVMKNLTVPGGLYTSIRIALFDKTTGNEITKDGHFSFRISDLPAEINFAKDTLSGIFNDEQDITISLWNNTHKILEQKCKISLSSDPLFPFQWHLQNDGNTTLSMYSGLIDQDINIKAAYAQGITGKGVTIVISDSGMQIKHPDLSPNVLISKSRNYQHKIYGGAADNVDMHDPVPKEGLESSMGDHGTSVAGIAASKGWNNMGGRGVAPHASIIGLNYISYQSNESAKFDQIAVDADAAIYNQSYGNSGTIVYPIDKKYEAALMKGVQEFRGNKGALYIKAAGNDFEKGENASLAAVNASPWFIIVGALNANGVKSSYSTIGSTLWISAPGGEYGADEKDYEYKSNNHKEQLGAMILGSPALITTDILSCDSGYAKSTSFGRFNSGSLSYNNQCDYTSTFSGTSSATPIISGVAALLLEKNPHLSWREVKDILAKSARKVDPNFPKLSIKLQDGSYTYEEGWVKNAAGFNFHHWYGFGGVDVGRALELANPKTYHPMPSYIYNPKQYTVKKEIAIPDFSTTGAELSLVIDEEYVVENAQVMIDLEHQFPRDLSIELLSPSGTKSILLQMDNALSDEILYEMRLLSNAFYGENSAGEWKLRVVDTSSESTGKLLKWSLRLYGHKNKN
ncbi:MAG: S8 family serine peptidase [Oligoflexia bacterium]|nr:S8 family serine peptidase [Oligoflexia bacterium]